MMIKARMRLNNNILFLIISVGCILQVASIADGSILPFLDQMTSPSSLLGETFLDPFRVLEHIPLALENRDESLSVATAKVDWKETPEGHMITVEVPGLKKDDIKIEVEENRVLRVSGERKKEEEKKGEHWHCVERSYGKFWRQFRMPENADLDTIKAKLENGVLSISFAKLSPDRIKGPKVVAIDTKAEETKSSHPSVKEEL